MLTKWKIRLANGTKDAYSISTIEAAMVTNIPTAKKPCEFIASAKEDLSAMPDDVKEVIGFAIFMAVWR